MTLQDESTSAPYDWNTPTIRRQLIDVGDCTLSDGLLAPSVVDPSQRDKRRLLSLLPALGVRAVTLGHPGLGMRQFTASLDLARELMLAQWELDASCAARATVKDVASALDVRERSGLDIELAIALPASPVRLEAEGMTVDRLRELAETSMAFAARAGARVVAVIEDATRTPPEQLGPLLHDVIAMGAGAVRLSDSAGRSTPDGARALVQFASDHLHARPGRPIRLDWAGHNDRGLALANALAAVDAGVDRVIGSALGLGARSGGIALEHLLTNLRLGGAWPHSLRTLTEFCESAAVAFGIAIAPAHAVVGGDAFRTGSGADATALVKALRSGDPWLADHVVSGVPAGLLGQSHHVDISPVSGLSNVRWWLSTHGYDGSDQLLTRELLLAVKQTQRAASDEELHELVAALLAARLVRG
jgi:2-isopropylmalate synthase